MPTVDRAVVKILDLADKAQLKIIRALDSRDIEKMRENLLAAKDLVEQALNVCDKRMADRKRKR